MIVMSNVWESLSVLTILEVFFFAILHLLFISTPRIIWPKDYFKQQYRGTIIRTPSCCRLIASVLVTSKQWGGDQDVAKPRVIYEDNPSTILDASFKRIFDRYVVTLVLHDRQSIDVTCPKGSRGRKRFNPSSAISSDYEFFSFSISAPKMYHTYFISMLDSYSSTLKISILIQSLWVTIIHL